MSSYFIDGEEFQDLDSSDDEYDFEDSGDEYEDDDSSLIYEELSSIIDRFLDTIFKDADEVITFNKNFLQDNGFQFNKQIDYTLLFRFIKSQYSSIYSIEPRAIDALLEKFYRDIDSLYKFYQKLFKMRDEKVSYYSRFIKKNDGVSSLGRKIFKRDLNENEEEELDEILKEEFGVIFDSRLEKIKKELKLIINTKSYYFDSLLWKEAKKYRTIFDFFSQSIRVNIRTVDDLSIKIFILQYLNSIDLSQVKDRKWHKYLQDIIKVID